jgi:hypothetical protein
MAFNIRLILLIDLFPLTDTFKRAIDIFPITEKTEKSEKLVETV